LSQPRVTRFYVALLLVAVITGSLMTVLALSYNSAHGTVIQLVSASRIRSDSSSFGPTETLTYVVDVHVWSWGGSLETFVNKPTFSLLVDNYSLPIPEYGNSTGFKTGSYTAYRLIFATADENAIRAERFIASSTLQVSMVASVTAGIYTEQRMVSDSTRVTW
jgi:hypothetical protein